MARLFITNTIVVQFEEPFEIINNTLSFIKDDKVLFSCDGSNLINKDPIVIQLELNPKPIIDRIIKDGITKIVCSNHIEDLKVDYTFVTKCDTIQFINKWKYNKPKQIAAFTHVYNDIVLLKRWIEYYSKEVGIDNIYIIDHGSTIKIKDCVDSKVNVITIPRGESDQINISLFCSYFQRFLLTQYKWVIHTDVDEILMCDNGDNFETLFSKYTKPCALTPKYAYDILHDHKNEPSIDLNKKILEQRKFMTDAGFSYLKPCITSKPISWGAGFHKCYDVTETCDNLWLFHLKYFDADMLHERNKAIWSTVIQSETDKTVFPFAASNTVYNSKTVNEVKEHINRRFENSIVIPETFKSLF
jgi:hypothetical protein